MAERVGVVFCVLAFLVLGAPCFASARSNAIIERVGWEVGDRGAHVVVAVKGQVDYSSHTAPADPKRRLPPRAYVDLKPARLGRAIAREPIEVEDGLVRRLRIGQFDPETVRIVVDLRSPALFDVRTADRPPRLILSLRLPEKRRPERKAATRPGVSASSAAPSSAGVGKAPSAVNAGQRRTEAPPGAAKPRPFRVVIDPGHGGKDPGARGAGGENEKTVTLRVAKLVAQKLEEDPRISVKLTRIDDRGVSLKERTAFANSGAADLFLSIHANASGDGKARGIETYTLNNTRDQATNRLAALENGLELAGMDEDSGDLAFILSDLLQTGKEGESEALAASLQEETVGYVSSRWKGVADLGVKKGPFFVLVGAYMPCALIEVGFLTHPLEGHRLLTHRYQEDLAEGIARGVRQFLRNQASSATVKNL